MTIYLTLWIILQNTYKLPNELILTIMYNFRGLEHPLSIQLKKHTCVKYYKYLQQSTFGKQIQKLHKLNKIHLSMLHFTKDYGYFIPRNYNMLYYNRNDENDIVQKGMDIKLWNLNRFYSILYKKGCYICGCQYPIQTNSCYNRQLINRNKYTCDLCSEWIGTSTK